MIDLVQQLAGMMTGNHKPGTIKPAAGNPAVPMGMPPDHLAQQSSKYAMGGQQFSGGPTMAPPTQELTGGPTMIKPGEAGSNTPTQAPVAGGGWTETLLRGLKGAQAGMDAGQKMQGGPMPPQWAPMPETQQQGMILPPNRQGFMKRY